jgi:hypothetical protein
MTRADRVLSTPPLSTCSSVPTNDLFGDDYPPTKAPLHSYLLEAIAISILLIGSGFVSTLIASHLEGKIATMCSGGAR